MDLSRRDGTNALSSHHTALVVSAAPVIVRPFSPWARLRSLLLVAVTVTLVARLGGTSNAAAEPTAAPDAAPARPHERIRSATRAVARNQGPGQVLAALGLNATEQKAMLDVLKEHLPFRRIRPGDQVRVERRVADGAVHSLSWRQGPADEIIVRGCDAGYCAERRAVAVTRETTKVSVTLRSSLFEALRAAGQDPSLAQAATDVLAWDVDFYQDVRAGDELQIIVERVAVDGRFLRYGDVLAAQYAGSIAGRKRLFRYTDPDGHTSYYDEAGQSAQRGFLRAPVPVVHVTSRFGRRDHPLLQYVKKHQGVDYGAPTGTPVWAVGDGQVAQAGWSGGCGLAVTIRHRGGLESQYCHLSKVHVSAGARVAQKDVIGKVGATGMATGPHLHYAVRRGGAFVNPLQLIVPRGEPLKRAWMEDFVEKVRPYRSQFDETPVASL